MKAFKITESHINRLVAVQLHSWREYTVPKWGYSITEEELDPEKTVKASAREIRVSHKHAREVCRTIKGMMLNKAKQYLRDVMAKKKPVPYKRFTKKLGHRHGLEKAFVGKYPVKASKHILKLLEGAEANAENKGLDTDRLRIIHAAASQGMKMKRFKPRAQGRATPKYEILCHIEIALEEKPETGGEA
nr:50S ribosomal protein L22, large subunit ribosomal protein L22 [uncultured archaeon]